MLLLSEETGARFHLVLKVLEGNYLYTKKEPGILSEDWSIRGSSLVLQKMIISNMSFIA